MHHINTFLVIDLDRFVMLAVNIVITGGARLCLALLRWKLTNFAGVTFTTKRSWILRTEKTPWQDRLIDYPGAVTPFRGKENLHCLINVRCQPRGRQCISQETSAPLPHLPLPLHQVSHNISINKKCLILILIPECLKFISESQE